jgi:hypothetical protein
MKRLVRSILLWLALVLTLAGCRAVTDSAASTPTVLPSSTPTWMPIATQTPRPLPTPTIEKTSVDANDAVVLSWEREGGLAGFCDEVIVYAGGEVLSRSCHSEATERTRLSVARFGQLSAWRETLKPFEHVQSDGAVADGMTVRLNFAGQGTQAATDEDVQAMLDFAASLLPPSPPAVIPVLQTGVRYVLASRDVTMHTGPGKEYLQIGQVFDGQVAWVTGVSTDGAWWRVICPDETVSSCWLSADPALTQPTTPQGTWPVFMFPRGMSVDYPAGWLLEPSTYDETQHSVWFVAPAVAGPSVGVEIYHRPTQERDVANPFTWQPNQGGYEVHWSRPITTVQGLVGIEFVWGAYLENQQTWDTPPQLMVVYYSPEHELDVRVSASFDASTLDLLDTASLTETVATQFGLFHHMAQSVRLHPTTGWQTYHDDQAGGIFDLKYPPGWAIRGTEIDCGVAYDLDSLELVLFDACSADTAGRSKLTFFETYRRFRGAFSLELAITRRDVNGLRVEVVQYGEARDNGIVPLDAGPGTVAVWQIGERGFALLDQGNQHLQDGIYDGVLGSFLILGTMWSQPQPVEGYYAPDRRMAFDLPGLPVTVLLPAGYGVTTNTEYLRRGSIVSFDFTPYDRELPRLAEIQFFSEASLQAFEERCTTDFCFEGDYPNVERYRAQKAALAECADLPPYQAMRFDDRCYLVGSHRCTGDMCVIREYTTFLGDTKVDVWVMMRDPSQADSSDTLFATFDIVQQGQQ